VITHPPVEPPVVAPAPATINAMNPEYVKVPYDPAWGWPVRLKSQRWHPRGSTRRKDRLRARRLARRHSARLANGMSMVAYAGRVCGRWSGSGNARLTGKSRGSRRNNPAREERTNECD